MLKNEFLISELAEKADVTVRTIRYYLAEGLLPAPIIHGKYAYFTREHLDRLELIRRLKDIYLPLEDIKNILNNASGEDISKLLSYQDALRQTALSPKPEQQPKRPGKAALEYISKIKEPYPAKRESGQPELYKIEVSERHIGKETYSETTKRETWEHIQLAPGVELLVMATIDPDLRVQIKKLVQYAQQLFTKKSGGTK